MQPQPENSIFPSHAQCNDSMLFKWPNDNTGTRSACTLTINVSTQMELSYPFNILVYNYASLNHLSFVSHLSFLTISKIDLNKMSYWSLICSSKCSSMFANTFKQMFEHVREHVQAKV